MKPRRFGVPPEAGEVIASYSDDTAFKGHTDCRAAKSGDTEAAIRQVQAIVKPTTVEAARERFGQNVAYVPVLAQEATGRNKIPVVLAAYYAQATGATLARDVVQTNTAFHTGARPLALQ